MLSQVCHIICWDHFQNYNKVLSWSVHTNETVVSRTAHCSILILCTTIVFHQWEHLKKTTILQKSTQVTTDLNSECSEFNSHPFRNFSKPMLSHSGRLKICSLPMLSFYEINPLVLIPANIVNSPDGCMHKRVNTEQSTTHIWHSDGTHHN